MLFNKRTSHFRKGREKMCPQAVGHDKDTFFVLDVSKSHPVSERRNVYREKEKRRTMGEKEETKETAFHHKV
jgi:hypothetical protein